jgi:5-methylcytosine-specific restriction endonuclease McrA
MTHAAEQKELVEKWRSANPEKVRLTWLNRRHRKNGGRLSWGIIKLRLEEQNQECTYCKTDLSNSGFEIDHVVPLSKGGKHEDANIQLLCRKCNRDKHAKLPEEYLKELKARQHANLPTSC